MKEGNNEQKNSEEKKEKTEITRLSLMNDLKYRQNKKKLKEVGSLENLYNKKTVVS